MHLALATCSAMPGLAPDDRHLLAALRARGHEVEPVVWEDPHAEWAVFDGCVIRSAWDYSYRLREFLEWARRVGRVTPLWNPLGVVEWNTHKRYLLDLAARGVPTVPTVLAPAGSEVDLARVMGERGWKAVILKAAVAQSGRYIRFVDGGRVAEGQAHLDRLLPHEDMLVQRFVETVSAGGELSLIWIDGEWTHAVRKRAAPGDFRVHDDYGGSVTRDDPAADELDVAQAAVAAVAGPLLYARVDVVRGPDGRPMVMEFELVEPELFFRVSGGAVERFVAGVERLVVARGGGNRLVS